MNYLKIFEAYVLRTLSILTIVLSCFLLFEKSWVVGGSILLMSIFIFGGIGQNLKHNKTKSISGLLEGQDFGFNEKDKEEKQMSQEESRLIAKPFMFTIWTLIVVNIIVLIHYNYGILISILFAFLIGFFLPIILFLAGIFISKQTSK